MNSSNSRWDKCIKKNVLISCLFGTKQFRNFRMKSFFKLLLGISFIAKFHNCTFNVKIHVPGALSLSFLVLFPQWFSGRSRTWIFRQNTWHKKWQARGITCTAGFDSRWFVLPLPYKNYNVTCIEYLQVKQELICYTQIYWMSHLNFDFL